MISPPESSTFSILHTTTACLLLESGHARRQKPASVDHRAVGGTILFLFLFCRLSLIHGCDRYHLHCWSKTQRVGSAGHIARSWSLVDTLLPPCNGPSLSPRPRFRTAPFGIRSADSLTLGGWVPGIIAAKAYTRTRCLHSRRENANRQPKTFGI